MANPNGSASTVPSQYVPGKHGRPTIFTNDVATEICDRLKAGESLEQIGALPHLPDRRTVLTWLFSGKPEHERFLVEYRRAREAQSEAWVDDMVPIADKLEGKERHEVRAAELKIRTRQWVAERLQRQVYGPKVEHTHTGNVNVKINLAGKPGDGAKVIDHAENGEVERPKLPKAETSPSSD